jgi:hypothetical protein
VNGTQEAWVLVIGIVLGIVMMISQKRTGSEEEEDDSNRA